MYYNIVLINSYKRMSWVIAMTKEQHSVIDYIEID